MPAQELGRLQEAEKLFREALAGRRNTLGNEHEDTAMSGVQLVRCRVALAASQSDAGSERGGDGSDEMHNSYDDDELHSTYESVDEAEGTIPDSSSPGKTPPPTRDDILRPQRRGIHVAND